MTSTSNEPTHHTRAFSAFMDEFIGESDRAAVILGASKVDNLLYEILDKYLLPNPASTDDLLEGDSPLGTFSSRIKITYRLGLIDAQATKQLNIFRKLRNSFAHEVASTSLSVGAAKDRVSAIAEPFLKTPLFQSALGMVATQMSREPSDHGVVFRATLAVFYGYLSGIREHLTPIRETKLPSFLEICSIDPSQ